MQDCLFCKIVKGEIPSYKIYEDEFVYAFLDINPESNGHTLVIPKKHNLDIKDIENDSIIHIMNAARKIMEDYDQKISPIGYTLLQNNGEVQEVKHFHLHILPRYSNPDEKTVEEMYDILKN